MAKGLEGGSEKLTELLATLAKINTIDLTAIAEAAERAKTVQDRFREELEKGKSVSRLPPKKKKMHHSTKRKYLREYHANVRKPRNAKARAELLKVGGWFPLLEEGWRKAGVPVEVTREEWEEAVGLLTDAVPVVGRYRTDLPVTLRNVIVRDRDSGRVVFDGAEWDLRARGYIL